MPDVNTDNQPTPVSTSPQTKKTINWKRIGIISVITAIVIGGLGYAAVVLDIFESKPTGEIVTVDKQTATPSSKPTKQQNFRNKILLGYLEKLGENTYTNGIYLLDPENPPPKKLIDNPDYKTKNNSMFQNLKVTTDGKYLGWWKAGRTRNPTVEYAKVDELEPTKIKRIEGKVASDYIEHFTWSPNGQQIAILERIGKGAELSYRARVFKTETAKQISEFQVVPPTKLLHSVNFAWSKTDKLRAIFIKVLPPKDKFTSGGEEYRVYSYSPNGNKEFDKIIYSSAKRPIFDISDDGENVAFVKKFLTGNKYRGELWYGSINGSNIKKIAETNLENCSNGSPLAISPSKSWAIVGSGCADTVKAKIINITSGKVITAETDGVKVTWSPDSKQIWVTESLHKPDGSPLSQSNYILSLQGKIAKTFQLDFSNVDIAWFPQ